MRDVLAVEPKTLVEVERGVPAVDFLQLEQLYNFFDVDLFPVVFRRPAEQAKIIAQRFGRVALLDINGNARAFIALAHLGAVLIQNERDMCEARRNSAKCLVKFDVLRRVRKMVFAADDV